MIRVYQRLYSTKGKLQDLSRICEESDFDSEWKEQVAAKVGMCSSIPYEDDHIGGNCTKGR